MATADHRAARTASFGVGLVAITAAVISLSHVRALALRAGESELTSWLLPVSIDGAVVAAVSVLLADSRAGRRPAPLTWLLLALGLVASLAANVASAEPTATARAVAAWPPVALALGIEVLAGLTRRSDREAIQAHAGVRRWAVSARTIGPSGNGNGVVASGRPADGISGRRPVSQSANVSAQPARPRPGVDDRAAVDRIRALDAAASGGRASRLQIQKALGCGGSRAARLAELARRPVPDSAS
ncbi:hypothetical protein ACVW00_003652 [Marmoricola sp. URHA0025 HA25]